MGTVITQDQVGFLAVQEQVCGFEGDGESLDALAEVKGVPNVTVFGVRKKVLRTTRRRRNIKLISVFMHFSLVIHV